MIGLVFPSARGGSSSAAGKGLVHARNQLFEEAYAGVAFEGLVGGRERPDRVTLVEEGGGPERPSGVVGDLPATGALPGPEHAEVCGRGGLGLAERRRPELGWSRPRLEGHRDPSFPEDGVVAVGRVAIEGGVKLHHPSAAAGEVNDDRVAARPVDVAHAYGSTD